MKNCDFNLDRKNRYSTKSQTDKTAEIILHKVQSLFHTEPFKSELTVKRHSQYKCDYYKQ